MLTRNKKRKLDENRGGNKNNDGIDNEDNYRNIDQINNIYNNIPRDWSSSDEDDEFEDDEEYEGYEDDEEYEGYEDDEEYEKDEKEYIPFPIKVLFGTPSPFKIIPPETCKKDIIKKKIEDSRLSPTIKQKLQKKLQSSSLDEKQYNWFDTFLDIPFGKYADLPVDIKKDDVGEYFVKLQDNLDKAVYGMQTVKEEVINYIAQNLTTIAPSPRILALHGVAGVGKCLHPDTPVLLYSGDVIYAKYIKSGDVLMGDDSTPRNVLSTCKGVDPMYKIKQKYRENYIVNEPHILSLRFIRDVGGYREGEKIDIGVGDYLNLSKDFQDSLVGYSMSCNFSTQYLEIHPYLVGFWLGCKKNDDTCEIILPMKISSSIKSILESNNLYILLVEKKNLMYRYKCLSSLGSKGYSNELYNFLLDNNLLNNKHIPYSYLINSRSNRLQLLAGIIDAVSKYDLDKNRYVYKTRNKKLFNDLVFLCRSLGLAVKKKSKLLGDKYRCYIFGNGIESIPVRNNDKSASPVHHKEGILTPFKIKYLGLGEYCGFELDGNHRFLLGDFTVTHNTKLIREGISKALGRPLQTFSMGGIRDAQHFTGFDYTYVNSKHGAIAQSMIDSNVMNPVIFLDELDKISSTNEGEEIENLLVHLTDPIQNHDFKDKYFGEFPIDLSKVIFIFAFNNIDKINPILKDRLHIIHIPSPTVKEKIIIAKNYVFDELIKNTGLVKEDIIFTDKALEYIIKNYSKSEGVRQLKRCIETILLKLNTVKLLGESVKKIKLSIKLNSYKPPYVIDEKNVSYFLECHKTEEDNFISHQSMYI